MTKQEKIKQAIKKHESEIERLTLLSENVIGDTIEVCPICKTKNLHWNIDNTFTCACC